MPAPTVAARRLPTSVVADDCGVGNTICAARLFERERRRHAVAELSGVSSHLPASVTGVARPRNRVRGRRGRVEVVVRRRHAPREASELDERAVGVDRRGAGGRRVGVAGREVVRPADVHVRPESAVRGLLTAIQEDERAGALLVIRARDAGPLTVGAGGVEVGQAGTDVAVARIRRGSRRRSSSRCQCRGRSRTLHRTGSRPSRIRPAWPLREDRRPVLPKPQRDLLRKRGEDFSPSSLLFLRVYFSGRVRSSARAQRPLGRSPISPRPLRNPKQTRHLDGTTWGSPPPSPDHLSEGEQAGNEEGRFPQACLLDSRAVLHEWHGTVNNPARPTAPDWTTR